MSSIARDAVVQPATTPRPFARINGELRGVGFPECAAAFALVSLYSSAAYYIFGHVFPDLKPQYFYFAFYFLGACVFTGSASASNSLGAHLNVIVVWFALIVLMSVQFLFFGVSPEGFDLYVGRVHFFLTIIASLLVLGACGRFDVVVGILAIVVAMSCLINVAEFFYLGDTFGWMSNVPGRAAGLFENSNDSAMFICLGIPLVALNARYRIRWLFYGITLLGTYVTFSRGGLVLWATFVSMSELMLGYGKRGWGASAILACAMVVGLLAASSYFSADLARIVTDTLWPYLDANTSARVAFLDNSSTDERWYVLQRGIEAFFEAPIFGQGVGYTHSWDVPVSVHNMLVLMLAEMGIVGGVWFAAFTASLWMYGRPYGLLLTVMFLLTSLFTHNHFERPAVALLIALYAVAAKRYRPRHAQ